jgi:branched-subunit amino acid transport protein
LSALGPLLVMAAGVFGLRLSGLLLAGTAIPPAWERALAYVPVATLTALVVGSVAGHGGDSLPRLGAALGAALLMYRWRRSWVCIAGGMALYALLRLV